MKFDLICMFCGKKFALVKYRVYNEEHDKYYWRDFCSEKCLSDYYKEERCYKAENKPQTPKLIKAKSRSPSKRWKW